MRPNASLRVCESIKAPTSGDNQLGKCIMHQPTGLVTNEMSIRYGQVEWGAGIDVGPSLEFAGIDYYTQFTAARALLSRQDQWSAASSQQLQDSARRTRQTRGDEREWMIETHVELIHQSIYEDAARSMAAVGMLAPLIESLFKQLYRVLKREWPHRADVVGTVVEIVEEEAITAMPHNLEPAFRVASVRTNGLCQAHLRCGLAFFMVRPGYGRARALDILSVAGIHNTLPGTYRGRDGGGAFISHRTRPRCLVKERRRRCKISYAATTPVAVTWPSC